MLTLRQRIFIIIGVVAALAIVIITLILVSRKKILEENTTPTGGRDPSYEDQISQTKPSQTLSNGLVIPAGEPFVQPTSNLTDEEMYIKQLARIFVERFATYSNQNGNQNVEDIRALITPDMQAWVKTQRQEYSLLYKGITTEVMSTSFLLYKSESASIEVRVNQTIITQPSIDQPQTQSSRVQKKGKVDLVKIGGEWKVNGFWWID